ncbi:MAG TPA: hypothetical protein VL021_08710 [Brumimicrobium sp.]|nr:hypothetical protein [Brumimicrobium sp.]
MKNKLFMVLVLFIFSSCKKEVKIERNLWSKGGKWSIIKDEEIVISTWPANEKNNVNEYAGIFQFNKDGTGWRIYTDYSEAEKLNFKYTTTESKLSLNYYEYGEDYTEEFDFDWEKNSFILKKEHTNIYTVYSPNPEGDSLTIKDHRTRRMTCKKE